MLGIRTVRTYVYIAKIFLDAAVIAGHSLWFQTVNFSYIYGQFGLVLNLNFILFSVRNLLVMSDAFSLIGGIALVITSVMLLDALRKEQENAFIGK